MPKWNLLSDKTARELKRRLNARDLTDPGVNPGGGGVRQIIFVKVTADTPDEEGHYTCVPEAFSPSTLTWETYSESLCFEVNDYDLEEGERYLGVNYGNNDEGVAVFAVDVIDGYSTSSGDGTGITFYCVTDIAADGCGFVYDLTTYEILIDSKGRFNGFNTVETVSYSVDLSDCMGSY